MGDDLRVNALIKRAFLHRLEHARGQGDKSIEQFEVAIGYLEDYMTEDFTKFSISIAIEFKSFLLDHISEKTGETLSPSMITKICRCCAELLAWLAKQSKYQPTFSVSDAEYMMPTAKIMTVTRRQAIITVPDVAEFVQAVLKMPAGTIYEQRDRAMMATSLLVGPRANALSSLRYGSIDLKRRLVDQDGLQVRTKYGKRIVSWFFRSGKKWRTSWPDG